MARLATRRLARRRCTPCGRGASHRAGRPLAALERRLGAGVALAFALLASGCATKSAATRDAQAAPTTGTEWRPLFDGRSLAGWRVVANGASGAVEVDGGRLVLGQGEPMTEVALAEPAAAKFPRDDYEIELVAARLLGNDFFAGLTFPVRDGELTLILGGWGGGLCGLSCLDREDAAHNETKSFRGFERGRDYVVVVSVQSGRVRASVDGETIADVDVKGRRCSLRSEVEPCRPLGLASYQTRSAIRSLRWRPLAPR
jgi:hypothetical protein